MTMHALVTRQGKPVPESALCNIHLDAMDNRVAALKSVHQATTPEGARRYGISNDAVEKFTFHEVPASDVLACLVCGAMNDEMPNLCDVVMHRSVFDKVREFLERDCETQVFLSPPEAQVEGVTSYVVGLVMTDQKEN